MTEFRIVHSDGKVIASFRSAEDFERYVRGANNLAGAVHDYVMSRHGEDVRRQHESYGLLIDAHDAFRDLTDTTDRTSSQGEPSNLPERVLPAGPIRDGGEGADPKKATSGGLAAELCHGCWKTGSDTHYANVPWHEACLPKAYSAEHPFRSRIERGLPDARSEPRE